VSFLPGLEPDRAPQATDSLRAQLVQRFEAYLDEALATPDELAPELRALLELDTDPAPADALGTGEDLYSAWAALTALAQSFPSGR